MSIEDLRDEADEYQEDIEQDVDTDMDDDEQDIDDTDGEQDDNQDDGEADEADSLDFSFDDTDDDESDPFKGKPAPEWVKKVREENRELKRQLKQQQQSEQQTALREKPTLDAHDYDSDAFEQDYEAWLTEKQQHDAKVQAEMAKYQKYDDSYKASVDAVRAKAPDYDEIEQSIVDTLPVQRQALIKMITDNPARMVYALGKSPNKLQSLSELDDVQFAKQIVLMEANMSNVKRNPSKPRPKSHSLEGAAGGGDTQLAKLEAAADKSGDRSAVVAYKRKMRNK